MLIYWRVLPFGDGDSNCRASHPIGPKEPIPHFHLSWTGRWLSPSHLGTQGSHISEPPKNPWAVQTAKKSGGRWFKIVDSPIFLGKRRLNRIWIHHNGDSTNQRKLTSQEGTLGNDHFTNQNGNWDELSQPNTLVCIKFMKQKKYHHIIISSYHHINLYHTSSHWGHIGRCSWPKWATEIYGSLGVNVRSMHVPGKNLEKVAKCRLMVCFQDFSGFRHLIQKGIDMNRASKSPASCLHPSPYWSKILRDQYCGRFFHPKKINHIILS